MDEKHLLRFVAKEIVGSSYYRVFLFEKVELFSN